MEHDNEQFIVAEVLKPKASASTMHNIIRRPSIDEYKDEVKNRVNFVEEPGSRKENNEGSRHKIKSKQQPTEFKSSLKCVRIQINSSKSLEGKSYSCQNISSAHDIGSGGSCSIDEIDLGASQTRIGDGPTPSLNKKSSMSKSGGTKIKSFRDLHAKSQKSVIKSSRSIKFSEKKDVFTYKCENKKDQVRKKLKTFRKTEILQGESEECCQII